MKPKQTTMDKHKMMFQILKLCLIAAVLIITPLIPQSLRSTYLYFLFNLLILTLGVEAGLLSFYSKNGENKSHVNNNIATKPLVVVGNSSMTTTGDNMGTPENRAEKPKVVEKCSSEKIVKAVKVKKLRKSPSTPSIFFIGNGKNETEEMLEDDENGEEEELFAKAENFIGNFYKQLKMQREDSWKRIHGFH